jgi:hypothetical protein
MNNWPNPDKPGYPVDPETEGWHWLANAKDMPWPWFWFAEDCQWETGEFVMTPEVLARYKYLGPALTPAEVADVVDAIGEAAAEAMTAILNAITQDSDGETKH